MREYPDAGSKANGARYQKRRAYLRREHIRLRPGGLCCSKSHRRAPVVEENDRPARTLMRRGHRGRRLHLLLGLDEKTARRSKHDAGTSATRSCRERKPPQQDRTTAAALTGAALPHITPAGVLARSIANINAVTTKEQVRSISFSALSKRRGRTATHSQGIFLYGRNQTTRSHRSIGDRHPAPVGTEIPISRETTTPEPVSRLCSRRPRILRPRSKTITR
jgi:hypothetical protein